GCIKDKLFFPPLPARIDELKTRISAAIHTVTPNVRQNVWDECSYRLDTVRISGAGHI
ncbi:hypothetical protein AVEN_90196-1, partial [Araneus ventricosus]